MNSELTDVRSYFEIGQQKTKSCLMKLNGEFFVSNAMKNYQRAPNHNCYSPQFLLSSRKIKSWSEFWGCNKYVFDFQTIDIFRGNKFEWFCYYIFILSGQLFFFSKISGRGEGMKGYSFVFGSMKSR